MSDIAIRVENLSKQYRLGQVGTGTFAHDLNRWWHTIRGKEDPYLTVGEENNRSQKGQSQYVWALQDINFDVYKGEVLGLIGKNGAGKSTLLKILSRTTTPTTGSVKAKGRVASLLEVGTGFHPELSGRDNIFLNAAILGMTKQEVNQKFDEIVDFAGVERYIDTPVKRYSSGMYVRLAFAVAAHLEPEILIVDEVLAVGDAEFQKKAIGKMKDVSKGGGRTVLFVSHNMGAVQSLCTTGMVLKNGRVGFHGTSSDAINYYLQEGNTAQTANYINDKQRSDSDILQIKVLSDTGENINNFSFNEQIHIVFELKIATKHLNAVIGFRIKDKLERNVFTSQVPVNKFAQKEGNYKFVATIPSTFLVPNSYDVVVGFHVPNTEVLRLLDKSVSFNIEETGTDFYQYNGNDYGCVFVNCQWISI